MDRILKPGEPASNPPKLVRRRLPYSLDVAFAVLGNNQIVPELAANMTRTEGVPFRDGFPYQRNLAAVRLAPSQMSAAKAARIISLRRSSNPFLRGGGSFAASFRSP